jgi:threonine dehydratase
MGVTLAEIRAAREALSGIVTPTPLLVAERLSQELGAEIWLKAENMQRSGSFKVRGAWNKISRLSPAERAQGVITHSAGNHAQGVALAARLFGCPATIVMPQQTPLTKIANTQRLGAEIILHGASFDDAGERARQIQQERGLTYVHAFDDEVIIAGQGTIGLEIAEALPDLTLLVIPIGGGGLIAGIATAIKALCPQARIVGVQAVGCAPVGLSLTAGEPVAVPTARTIADGIAVKRPGRLTLPIIRELVDSFVTVDDDEISRAIAYLVQNNRLVVEGAGAAGVAALLAEKVGLRPGDRAATVLCGGNIDSNLLARILEQALVKQGRYLVLRTTVDDRPGNLAPLVGHVAAGGANVIDIFHRRAAWLGPVDRVGIEMILEVRNEDHAQAILATLLDHGYHVERVGQELWPL